MKKLLIASMTAALTAGVWAAGFLQTRDSFENWGTTLPDDNWQNATENVSAVEYGEGEASYTYGTPAANVAAFGGPGNRYLKLETDKGKALWRKLAEGTDATVTVDADNSYVFDTLVQFTATDEAPTAEADDKFIVWLKSDEAAGTTSLMATCGIIADEATSVDGSASVELDANVTAGQWARVSVKVFNLGDTENSVGTLGFVVYVDGVAVAAKSAGEYAEVIPATFGEASVVDCMTEAGKYYYNRKQVLPCLMSGDASNADEVANFGQMLTAVGFEGTGAIDDLQIVTAADAPSFTQYNPSEEPVVNPVAPGETVSAATADDAIAALIAAGIKAPATVTDADAYAAKFEATATDNGNGTFSATWTVKAAAEASLKSDADAALAQTLEAVLDDKKTTVTITAQPGFYYTVLSAATVDAAEYTPNGWALAGDTVELKLPEKSGTQGFYKIGISAVEVK